MVQREPLVLRRMFRGYTRRKYLALCDRAREMVPCIELASDFIVGFPGETDEEFAETVDLMERVRFQNCYVFKYSPRPGTKAAGRPDDVPDKIKRARNQVLLRIQERHSLGILQARIGTVEEVLVEGISKRNPRRVSGRTRSNQIVVFEGNADLAGRLVPVRILRASPLTLIGTREGQV